MKRPPLAAVEPAGGGVLADASEVATVVPELVLDVHLPVVQAPGWRTHIDTDL